MKRNVSLLVALVLFMSACSDKSFSNFKSEDNRLQVFSLELRGDHPDNKNMPENMVVKSKVNTSEIDKTISIDIPYLNTSMLFTPTVALTPHTFVKNKFPLDFSKNKLNIVISDGNVDVSYNLNVHRDAGNEINLTKFRIRPKENPGVNALTKEYIAAIDNAHKKVVIELPDALRNLRMVPYIESNPKGVDLGNMPQSGYIFSSEVDIVLLPLNKVDKKTYRVFVKFKE